MPEFRGNKNLQLGATSKKDAKSGEETLVPAWASAQYDASAKNYVIFLSDADAKKFRALSKDARHGFREVEDDDEQPEATDSEE